MALQDIPGAKQAFIGPNILGATGAPGTSVIIMDAALEAAISIGFIVTSDGGSHTIDTSGSSSIQWRSGNTTFANAGTSASVGIAAVDTGAGPPGRAVNVAGAITFDVAAVFTGGGGGITGSAWQTSVPTTGTKTIANGDFVAVCVQVVTRGGADTVSQTYMSTPTAPHIPSVTSFNSGTYAIGAHLPNFIITFSDGALGWIYSSDVMSTTAARTWNSGDATKEYGQLYNLPFPTKIYGIYGYVDPDNNFDVVLYSDALGTPVAEKTVSIDANTVASATGRRFTVMFSSPYSYTANTNIATVFKPGASNISTYYKTLADAAHRVTDPWGTSGYGISRASGAFANANSSLDHYYIGLIVGAFGDDASSGGRPELRGATL